MGPSQLLLGGITTYSRVDIESKDRVVKPYVEFFIFLLACNQLYAKEQACFVAGTESQSRIAIPDRSSARRYGCDYRSSADRIQTNTQSEIQPEINRYEYFLETYVSSRYKSKLRFTYRNNQLFFMNILIDFVI